MALSQQELERVKFTIKGEKIERMMKFRYLGCVLRQDDGGARFIAEQF